MSMKEAWLSFAQSGVAEFRARGSEVHLETAMPAVATQMELAIGLEI